MADKRDILIRLLGEETVARMATRAGSGLDRFGDSLDATERDAKNLDRQIAVVEGSLRQLAVAFTRTGDAADRTDITKAIRQQQTELRRLVKARSFLPDFGESDREAVRLGGRMAAAAAAGLSRASGAISAALGNVFGTLPPQAQVAIGAGLVGAVTAVAPLIGGTISGAIVGAAGTGGIIGGVALAAKNPQVQASAKQTGQLFSTTLQQAAADFVPATLDALRDVRGGIGEIEGDLRRAGRASAVMLKPLTGDVLAGAEAAVDGFATAVERSGPVVRVFGGIVREAGELAGDTFRDLSAHSAEGARALATFWKIAETGVRSVVSTINGLTMAYGWMEKLGAALMLRPDQVARLAAEEEAARQGSAGLSQELQNLIGSLDGTGFAADGAAVEVRSLADAAAELTEKAISSEQAQSRLEEAIDNAAEAAKRNGDGIDRNIPKQRANRDALVAIADAANTAAARILEETGSQEKAAAATERGRQKFLEVASAMGVSASQAKKLADRLFGIPASRTTTVRVLTDKATGELIGFEKRVNRLDGRTITVRTRITRDGEYIPGSGTQTRASGGPVRAGTPYLVGEEGPELITPTQSGFVHDAEKTAQLRAALLGERPTHRMSAVAGGGESRQSGVAGWDPELFAAAARDAFEGLTVQVFIGDRELTDIVDVQISSRNRNLKRRVHARGRR